MILGKHQFEILTYILSDLNQAVPFHLVTTSMAIQPEKLAIAHTTQ